MKKLLFIATILTTTINGFPQTATEARQERREQRAGGGVVHTPRGVDDPAAHAILRDVRRNLKSFRSLNFEFTLMTVNIFDRSADHTVRGTILTRGDRYNLTFMGLNMISDGRTVWSFNSETNEVHISRADPRSVETLNPLALIETYEQNFRAKLIREDIENGVTVAVIDLQPFEARTFHKVRVVTNKANRTIVRTEIHEKGGTIMTFRVDRMQTNVPAPDSQFRFDASRHPGVEVVDMR